MFYCGIDIAKHKHVVSIMDEKGQVTRKALSITNTREGFDQLLEALHGQSEAVSVGLEATGHYWLSLYDELTRQGYPVTVLNPLQIAAYRKTGIRKVKNDVSDSIWIADYIRVSNLPPTTPDLPVLLQLRELTRFRFRLSEQIGDVKRKLLCILDRVFPEYDRLFSSVFLQASRAVLQEAVSAHEFADFDLHELADLLSQASRGRFGQEKAELLQKQARQSVGVAFLADAARIEMGCLLAQINLLEQRPSSIWLSLNGCNKSSAHHLHP